MDDSPQSGEKPDEEQDNEAADSDSVSADEEEYNIRALAKAIAWHETKDCTLGYGKTHNNCFGFIRGGKPVYYHSKDDAYADFINTWKKYYDQVPDMRIARIYSGNDRPQAWLKNVLSKYEEYKSDID